MDTQTYQGAAAAAKLFIDTRLFTKPNNNIMNVQSKIIRELRQELDATITSAKTLAPSREAALIVTKLQEGRMLMGHILGAFGNPNPYPKDGSIAPATDLSPNTAASLSSTTSTDLAYLRNRIQQHLDTVVEFSKQMDLPGGFEFPADMTGVFISLRLAKNWAGVLLAHLNAQEDQKEADTLKESIDADAEMLKKQQETTKELDGTNISSGKQEEAPQVPEKNGQLPVTTEPAAKSATAKKPAGGK